MLLARSLPGLSRSGCVPGRIGLVLRERDPVWTARHTPGHVRPGRGCGSVARCSRSPSLTPVQRQPQIGRHLGEALLTGHLIELDADQIQ